VLKAIWVQLRATDEVILMATNRNINESFAAQQLFFLNIQVHVNYFYLELLNKHQYSLQFNMKSVRLLTNNNHING